jgi:hypothetical protein
MVAWDLIMGVALLGLVSAAIFWCGWFVAGRTPRWLAGVIALVTLALTLAFGVTLHGRLFLARILPFSNAIVVGNWIPLGAALLLGIIAREPTIPRWRRWAVTGMLATLAWYTVAYDLFSFCPRPGQPQFRNGVCMQTTASSCSACCAVGLLMHHGIPATETELMALCLARAGGIPELGLYRSLELKTRQTGWDVEILEPDFETLRRSDSYPVLLLVEGDEPGGSPAAKLWRPKRANHAIVVYGFADDGKAEVGDPASGRTRWTADKLRRCWYGDGLRLVRRQEKSSVGA